MFGFLSLLSVLPEMFDLKPVKQNSSVFFGFNEFSWNFNMCFGLVIILQVGLFWYPIPG